MDSTIEYNVGQRDTLDSGVEFRAQTRERDAGQLSAGITDSAAVGQRSDVDARQPADPSIGRWPVGFVPQSDPAATPPSAAAEASAVWRVQTHSTPYLTTTEVTYYGPHPLLSGAVGVVQSSTTESRLGCFVDPSSAQLAGGSATAPSWGEFTPTTTGARTNTTSTLTSTHVTCSTMGGPVHGAHVRGPTLTGLTSVRPAHQVFMPTSIEPSGRFPGSLVDPMGIPRPTVNTVERHWGDMSARSGLRPGFEVPQDAWHQRRSTAGRKRAKTGTSVINRPIVRQNRALRANLCTFKTTSGFLI